MGLRITQSILARQALADVSRLRRRLAGTQEQATSGLRINRPSDDPVGVRDATGLRGALAAREQFERNITKAENVVSVTESALGDAMNAVIRAKELAIQGANGTVGAEGRQEIAAEVRGLHDALLAAANTRFGGAYVFSGYTNDTQPFTPGAGLSVTFTGDPNEIEVAIAEAEQVPITLDGRRVFLGDGDGDGSPDAGREDLFSILADLVTALEANDQAGVGAQLDRLDRAQTQLNLERTRIGAVDSRLQAAREILGRRETELTGQLSDVQDADSIQVYSDIVNQGTALQASLRASASLVQPTLLDFI